MTSTPVDIYSMLNKAQQQYNSSNNNNNNNNQLDSVSAFFASVKSPGSGVMSDTKMSEVPVQQHGGVPRFHIQNRPMQVQQQTPVNFVNIEQIEKQHGVTNSVDIIRPAAPPNELANSPLANFLSATNLNTLNNNVIPGIRNVVPSPQMPFQSHHHSQIMQHQQDEPLAHLMNGNLLHHPHHPEIKAPVQKTISAPPGFAENSNKPLRNLLKENSLNNNNSSNSNKPSLIPPTMFVPPSGPIVNNDCKPSTPTFKPEPLTKNQLMQALSYLIENDDDFMKKLHEAYLKSFNSMVTL